jgi:hypothetical protein
LFKSSNADGTVIVVWTLNQWFWFYKKIKQ